RPAAMNLHRDFLNPQLAGHLLVQETRDYELQDFPLAPGQRVVTLVKCLELYGARQTRPTVAQRVVDRGEQGAVIDGLGEKFDGAGLHGADARGHVAVSADKDDRKPGIFPLQALLKLEPAQVSERHIEHDTRGRPRALRRQEVLRGAERAHITSLELNER